MMLQVPEHARQQQASLQMLPAKPGQPPAATAGTAGQGALWPGMSQAELLQAAQPLQHAAVLNIR